MKTLRSLLLAVPAAGMILVSPLAASAESDWPHWSGPGYDLALPGRDLFQGEYQLDRQWASPVGSGYSGIVVAGDRVVTAFSDGESDLLAGFEAESGVELWRYRIAETYEGHDQSEDGPLSTPTIHDGRVYALGPWGHLVALNLVDGKLVWARHVVEELGGKKPFHGFASAPVVIGGVLVVQTGGSDGHCIAGLDPADGQVLWQVEDDFVMYQSPVPVRVAGETLVFAVTDERVVGLRPSSGEVLWELPHELSGDPYHGVSQPVLVDTASVLLNGWTESALFRVTEAGEAYRIEEVWRTRALGFSLAASVPFEGHIYGYRGSFLSCLDAATGERVWRSRAPGAGALILVDGHLVILTGSGELVVAEASPAGFREKTRGSALEYGFYQRPSFARGRFFVRNLHEIARLDVTRAVPARVLAEPELVGEVGELVRALRAADDKARRIDEFLAAHPEMPILEGDTAHFLFRGEVEDLGLGGDLFAVEQPMHRVEGTNLYFRSVQLDPGARYEYYYSTFGEPRADPLNPHKTEAGSVKVSVLTTRGWEPPAHLRPPQGPRGRLETLSWDSELLGYPREVQVYLPPGYDEGAGRFPLLVVHGGDQALARGQMDRTLDNLIGTTVAPVVVAFVPEAHWSESMSGIAGYARALDEELIPLLDETYRTLARAEARGVMGAGSAAATSIYAVFDRPGVFGRLATQSLFMRDLGDDVHELIEAGNGRQLVLYLEWSRHDIQSIPRIDARAESKKVAEALERNGYDPVTHEAVGGSGWGGWRQRTDRVLESLFPWVEARAKAP